MRRDENIKFRFKPLCFGGFRSIPRTFRVETLCYGVFRWISLSDALFPWISPGDFMERARVYHTLSDLSRYFSA